MSLIATLIRCGDSFLSRWRLALALDGELHFVVCFQGLHLRWTVPEMPIHKSEVLLMSTPLLACAGKKVRTLVYWHKNPTNETESHLFSAQCGSGVCGWTVVGDCARFLPAAFAFLLIASLFAALRVPAMPRAVFVGGLSVALPLSGLAHTWHAFSPLVWVLSS